jgi:hypothetical protein
MNWLLVAFVSFLAALGLAVFATAAAIGKEERLYRISIALMVAALSLGLAVLTVGLRNLGKWLDAFDALWKGFE